ncbi:lytic transglycosylase domain-containing protein [Wukongibacter baidiensis]|uniref:lytic transglycosylase domain-containing protein n=1 Tax=Wukongibacter baidiensis TaxID=1723361 RepID=UPI003D7F20E2
MGIFDLRRYRIVIALLAIGMLIFICVYAFNFAMKTVYPLHYEGLIKKYSEEYDLDILFVASVIRAESKFDSKAVSPKGAKGLMQIASITGRWASKELGIEGYDEEMLFNPEVNIKIGCWYLNKLRKEFGDNTVHILAAYNAGSGNVSKWLRNEKYCPDGEQLVEIPFGETKRYIERVERNFKIYNYLYKEF